MLVALYHFKSRTCRHVWLTEIQSCRISVTCHRSTRRLWWKEWQFLTGMSLSDNTYNCTLFECFPCHYPMHTHTWATRVSTLWNYIVMYATHAADCCCDSGIKTRVHKYFQDCFFLFGISVVSMCGHWLELISLLLGKTIQNILPIKHFGLCIHFWEINQCMHLKVSFEREACDMQCAAKYLL